jgi:thymidine kinase
MSKEKLTFGGSIDLIIGPMFSGKTTRLLNRLNIRTIGKRKCLLIKYSQDNRYNEVKVVSHDGMTKDIDTVAVEKLSSVKVDGYDVIGIDEGQFFVDLVEYAELFANIGKEVFVSALSSNFKREAWSNVANLIPKCEFIHKCYAICIHCGEHADFSKRTTKSMDEKDIGGKDKYDAVCRSCYHQ